ncbi:MAG: hypothetical protein MI755_12845 [Sphingomonadales bacterium]|nr:hypothetical protein [Sphingomonadales bacterium]
MAGDEMAVFCDDQVRLDEIGAEIDGKLVSRQGVLRQIAAGAAMGDDDGLFAGKRREGFVTACRRQIRRHTGDPE